MGYPTEEQFEEARRDRTPPASRRKNPDNKPLRIVKTRSDNYGSSVLNNATHDYAHVLASLAQSQALLVKAGKESAMPHFIAIVKELERLYGFKFEVIPDEES
jgi:hypothetical protein